ncbi:MAG: glycoside hydrolase family 1 protein [Gemmatimonadota bacterium]
MLPSRKKDATEIAALLPPSFLWGVATSAYQIEGALEADGRGPSIWESFSRQQGAIERAEDASVACDHYNRLQQDLDLIAALGVDSYRFSIAWPRIQPHGRGGANPGGIAFYDRLVDGLLARGIRPFPTLYHWDLPQALEDSGGWASRDTAERFAEYAGLVLGALGDRVRDWALFNEPFIFASRGYLLGRYAPGRRSARDFLRAVHVIVMAHALGWRAARAARPDAQIGSVFAMAPCEPGTNTAPDREAAAYADAVFNHLFLGPLMRGAYPTRFLESVPVQSLEMIAGDEEVMRTPLDFIGVNCYYRLVVSADGHQRPDLTYLMFDLSTDSRPSGGHVDLSGPRPRRIHKAFGGTEGSRTEMGWEIWPRALRDVLLTLSREYPGSPIEICESGCAIPDVADADGIVVDAPRIAYHRAHIMAIAEAIEGGADVRSYHAWSLCDNFEWASGYRPRFGLVRVDYATQKRTVKASGEWFREICREARSRRNGAGAAPASEPEARQAGASTADGTKV